MPVKGKNGATIGVIGLHINFSWAEEKIRSIAAALGIDALLMSQDGTPIISTLGGQEGLKDLAAFRLSSLGSSRATLETWPDGRQYFSVVSKVGAEAGQPSFGWRLIGRIEGSAFSTLAADSYSAPLISILVLFSLLGIATVFFVRMFFAPLEKLAANAEQISLGKDIYPFESRRTAELGSLSESLARLQSRAD
jgi:hypothetical protein